MPVIVSGLLKIKLKNALTPPKKGQPAMTFGTAIRRLRENRQKAVINLACAAVELRGKGYGCACQF